MYTFMIWSLPLPALYKLNKLLHVVKIVIIAVYSLAVINHAVFLVSFKTVEQSLNAVSLDKQRETVRLYLRQKSFFAISFTQKAVCYSLFARAFQVFTPFLIGTFTRSAPAALVVFGTQTASQTSPRYSKLSFHYPVSLPQISVLSHTPYIRRTMRPEYRPQRGLRSFLCSRRYSRVSKLP